MATNPNSTLSRVRDAMKSAGGPLRIVEIRDMIGLSGSDGYARVNRAMQDLIKARQAERHHHGRYVYLGDRPDAELCEKQRRMHRIMEYRARSGRTFTAREVAEQAECSLYLARECIGFLRRRGILRQDGQKKVCPSVSAPLYAVEEDRINTEWPFLRKGGRIEIDGLFTDMRALAGRFFSIETSGKDTAKQLRDAADGLGRLVSRFEEIKRSR